MEFQKDQELLEADKVLKSYGRFIRSFNHILLEDPDERMAISEKVLHLSINGDKNENIDSIDLLQGSENTVLTKILIVLLHLRHETTKLYKASKEIVQNLMLTQNEIDQNDKETDDSSSMSDEERLQKNVEIFSFALEDLLNMKFLIQNIIFVIINLINQLSAMFSSEKSFFCVSQTSFFPSALDDIAKLLQSLMIFDDIIRNSDFRNYLEIYGEIVQTNTQQNVESEMFKSLLSTLHELHMVLDGGSILHLCLDNLSVAKIKIGPKSVKKFESFFLTYLKNLSNSLNSFDGSSENLEDVHPVMKINVMTILYQALFQSSDMKNVLRITMDINSKFPAIVSGGIVCNHIWNGNEVLQEFIPSFQKNISDVTKQQEQYLTTKINHLEESAINWASLTSQWILQIHKESKIDSDRINDRSLKLRSEIFYQGYILASQMQQTTQTIILTHVKLGKVMSMNLLFTIFKLYGYINAIKKTIRNSSEFTVGTVVFVLQYLQFHTLKIIGSCLEKVMVESSKEKKFDLISSLRLIKKLLYGTVSIDRINLIYYILDLTEPAKCFGTETFQRLRKLLEHMSLVCQLHVNLEACCESSFLFWQQSLLIAYMKSMLDCPLDLQNMFTLFQASIDSFEVNSENFEAIEEFKSMLERKLQHSVVGKLCNSIEINLRLDHHSHIQVEKFNPFNSSNNVVIADYRAFLKSNPFILNNHVLSLQENIEHYLSKTFYDLTTVSFGEKDWKTYEEIKLLADWKYSVTVVDDHLSTQTLDHGVDAIEIMKNIHIFVTKYNYNLNNQIFVEVSNNSQHLNTISIKNIANSLKTHGNGIINTAVNYVYQFLRKKFTTFSQFLYDEKVKSRLIKEVKHFKDCAGEPYNFDRAMQLNREMKKLGTNNKGENCFDLFRKLISHIGNSLGYIRMLRSSMNHVSSQACVHLPSLDEELEFLKEHQSDNVKDTYQGSLNNLQKEIIYLSSNYDDGESFFRVCNELRNVLNYFKLIFLYVIFTDFD